MEGSSSIPDSGTVSSESPRTASNAPDLSLPTTSRLRRILTGFVWCYIVLYVASAASWTIVIWLSTTEQVRSAFQQVSWGIASELNELLVEYSDKPGLQKLWIEGMLLTNPEASIYLVDKSGRIAETVSGRPAVLDRIDPAPLLRSLDIKLPKPGALVGEDPANPGAYEAFSVSRALYHPEYLRDGLMLYVIIWNGRNDRTTSHYMIALIVCSMLTLLVAFIGCWRAVQYLERKLSALQGEVDREAADETNPLPEPKDDLDLLQNKLSSFRRQLILERSLLEARVSRRIQMILNLVHDLRIPLTAARGFGERLAKQGAQITQELREQFILTVRGRIAAEERLARDLFTLSDLDGAKFQEQPELSSPLELLHQIVDDSAPAAAREGITLVRSLPGELPPIAHYPELLRRAIQNLIHNALKFTPQGGSVGLGATITEDGIQIRVSDTGIGIPEAEIPFLFESFYRVKGEEHEKREGTGLGLAISREIAVRHRGDLTVTSTLGKGSTFVFAIRYEHPEEADHPESPPRPSRALEWLKAERVSVCWVLVGTMATLLMPFLPVPVVLGLIALAIALVVSASTRASAHSVPRSAFRFAVHWNFVVAWSLAAYQLMSLDFGVARVFSAFLLGLTIFALPSFFPLRRAVTLAIPLVICGLYAASFTRNPGVLFSGGLLGVGIGFSTALVNTKTGRRSLQVRLVGGFLLLSWVLGSMAGVFAILSAEYLYRGEVERSNRTIARDLWYWAHRVGGEIDKEPAHARAIGASSSAAEYALSRVGLLAPSSTFMLIRQDCMGLDVFGEDMILPALEALRIKLSLEQLGWSCREEFLKALPKNFRFSIIPSPRFVQGFESLIVMSPSSRSLNLVSKELQRTLLRAMGRSFSILLLIGATFVCFIYFTLMNPLSKDLARLDALQQGAGTELFNRWQHETQSLLPAARIMQRVEAVRGTTTAAEAEDRRRREFVRWIGEQLKPSLEIASVQCDELLRRIRKGEWDQQGVDDLHEELLLQSELLRVSFELTKMEAREVRVKIEDVPLRELLEDAELEAVQMLSVRGVRVDLSDDVPDLGIAVDRRILELLNGTVLRVLYFAAPPGGTIFISGQKRGDYVEVSFKTKCSATRTGIVQAGVALSDKLLALHGCPPSSYWHDDDSIGIGVLLPLSGSGSPELAVI